MIIGTGQRIIKNEYRPDQQTRADFLQIDGGIHAVDIPLVQLAPQKLDGLAKTVNVKHHRKCHQQPLFRVISVIIDPNNLAQCTLEFQCPFFYDSDIRKDVIVCSIKNDISD